MGLFSSLIKRSQQQGQTPNDIGSNILGGLLGTQPNQSNRGFSNIGQIVGGVLGGQQPPVQSVNPPQNNPQQIHTLGPDNLRGGIFRNFFGNSPITRPNNNLPKQRWGRIGRLFGSLRQPQNQQPMIQQNPQQTQGVNQVNPISTFSK